MLYLEHGVQVRKGFQSFLPTDFFHMPALMPVFNPATPGLYFPSPSIIIVGRVVISLSHTIHRNDLSRVCRVVSILQECPSLSFCLLLIDRYLYGRRENQVSHWVDICKWGFRKVCDMSLSIILSRPTEAHICRDGKDSFIQSSNMAQTQYSYC